MHYRYHVQLYMYILSHFSYRYFITSPPLTLAITFLPVFMRARGFERRGVYAPIRLRLLFSLPAVFLLFLFIYSYKYSERPRRRRQTTATLPSIDSMKHNVSIYWRWDRETARKCKNRPERSDIIQNLHQARSIKIWWTGLRDVRSGELVDFVFFFFFH